MNIHKKRRGCVVTLFTNNNCNLSIFTCSITKNGKIPNCQKTDCRTTNQCGQSIHFLMKRLTYKHTFQCISTQPPYVNLYTFYGYTFEGLTNLSLCKAGHILVSLEIIDINTANVSRAKKGGALLLTLISGLQ